MAMDTPASAATWLTADRLSSRSDFLGSLFGSAISQHARMLQLESALPDLALIPERLILREATNELFEMRVDALSTSAHLDLNALIGQQLTVRLLQPDGTGFDKVGAPAPTYRSWHGYVSQALQLGSDGGLARYSLVMRPWLAFLEQRRDSFVYQDKTALEIIEDVFADHTSANARIERQRATRQAQPVQPVPRKRPRVRHATARCRRAELPLRAPRRRSRSAGPTSRPRAPLHGHRRRPQQPS